MHAGIRAATAAQPYRDRSIETERALLAVAALLALCAALSVALLVGSLALAVAR